MAYITENSVVKFRLREDTHEQKMLENFALQDNSHLTSTGEEAAVDARRSYRKAAVDTHIKAAAAKEEKERKLFEKIDKKISMTKDVVEQLEAAREEAVVKAADARHVINLCVEENKEETDVLTDASMQETSHAPAPAPTPMTEGGSATTAPAPVVSADAVLGGVVGAAVRATDVEVVDAIVRALAPPAPASAPAPGVFGGGRQNPGVFVFGGGTPAPAAPAPAPVPAAVT